MGASASEGLAAVATPPAALVRGFLEPAGCRQVAELAQAMFEAGELSPNVFQGNAWFVNLDRRGSLRPGDAGWRVIERLEPELLELLQPGPRGPDTYLGDFISYITPGGFVVRHRDDWQLPDPSAQCRVRCNVFVRKDAGSGDPCLGPDENVAGSQELRLDPVTGDVLVFSPSLTPHRATRVRGGPKIMLSIGFVVETGRFVAMLRRLGAPAGA
jgi:hypothetical protein